MSGDFDLEHIRFDELTGWADDAVDAAWPAFLRSVDAIRRAAPPLRRARDVVPALETIALTCRPDCTPRRFFTDHFTPSRIRPARGNGFVTAYYEPIVAGAREPSASFAAPILGFPADGRGAPLPDRNAIRRGALEGRSQPIVWLRDAVEVFLIQVQGSAKVRLSDGQTLRLVYDGRNGHPYTSIGRLLIEKGAIAPQAMSLETLKAWLRANGAGQGGPAEAVMDANASYVFFRAEPAPASEGPIGGQGVPLTAGRSIAVDRTCWSYGLPFWIDASLDDGPFRCLTVAQDTGSAILGPARADLFFGSGDDAGSRAGRVRHSAEIVVLLPKEPAP